MILFERFKVCKEHPKYFIGNMGTIRKIRPDGSMHILKQKTDKYGYKAVCICEGGKEYTRTVHRLVAISWIDNPLSKNQVNHIDGNKINNNKENLEWATHIENHRHGLSIGIKGCGYKQVVNLENGVVFDSVKEAYESRPFPFGVVHFERILRGDRRNKTSYSLI